MAEASQRKLKRDINAMFITEFLITSFIVVLMPGTGVIYTVSTGLTKNRKASLFAAIGCTGGIVPHLVASVCGLAAILHASALAFQVLKVLGVLYLTYLAWIMWKESGAIKFSQSRTSEGYGKIALRAFLINILNPKLSFFSWHSFLCSYQKVPNRLFYTC